METIHPGMLFEWVRAIGLPAIILVIWYFDHKKINGLENLAKGFRRLAEEGHEREKLMYDCQALSVACLSRIEQKIDSNVFCPVVRKETGK